MSRLWHSFVRLDAVTQGPSPRARRPGDPLRRPVLILNKSYQAIRIADAREAFTMLYGDRAYALDGEYEPYDFEGWAALEVPEGHLSIGTPAGRLRVPRLLLLRQYNRVPRTPLRLSRRNVFVRDEHTCQYCGATSDLTIDHVLPRSRGGGATWENLVACCRRCNLHKAWRTPEEAGMPLRRRPRAPNWTVVVQMRSISDPLDDWEPFLRHLRRAG